MGKDELSNRRGMGIKPLSYFRMDSKRPFRLHTVDKENLVLVEDTQVTGLLRPRGERFENCMERPCAVRLIQRLQCEKAQSWSNGEPLAVQVPLEKPKVEQLVQDPMCRLPWKAEPIANLLHSKGMVALKDRLQQLKRAVESRSDLPSFPSHIMGTRLKLHIAEVHGRLLSRFLRQQGCWR
jgi:hypothetical protein